MAIHVAVNPKYREKITGDHPAKWDYNNTFENMELSTLRDLAVWVYKGHPYCAQHEHVHREYTDKNGQARRISYRHSDNFLQCSVISLDFDKMTPQCSIGELATDPFISLYGGFLYPTVSSTPDKPRTRVVFQLEEPIADPGHYRLCNEALIRQYSLSDKGCKDVCRIFAGSYRKKPLILGKILPNHVIDAMARRYAEMELAKIEAKYSLVEQRVRERNLSERRIMDALMAIPSSKESLPYEDWRRVVAVIHDLFPDEYGIHLCARWTGTRNVNELPAMFRSFDRYAGKRAGPDTLFWLARRFGWNGDYEFSSPEEKANYYLAQELRGALYGSV